MSDLLERLKASRSTIGRVKIGEVELGLRVLTDADYQSANLSALEVLRTADVVDVNIATSELFESAKAIELICRAVVDPDTGAALFKTSKEAAAALTRDEKELLIEGYLAHEKKNSPRPETLTAEEFDVLLDTLKKTPEKMDLSNLSIETLKRLITSLVAQPSA